MRTLKIIWSGIVLLLFVKIASGQSYEFLNGETYFFLESGWQQTDYGYVILPDGKRLEYTFLLENDTAKPMQDLFAYLEDWKPVEGYPPKIFFIGYGRVSSWGEDERGWYKLSTITLVCKEVERITKQAVFVKN
jgi:hypothetical protein